MQLINTWKFNPTAGLVLAIAILAITTISLPVSAQVDDRDRGCEAPRELRHMRERGFYLGLKFIGSSLHVDDDGDGVFFVKDDGGGLQLHAGYSFNRVFSLEFSVGAANHETSVQSIDADFSLVQLFAHYRFRPGHGFRPYVKGGIGGYGLKISNNVASVRVEGGGVPIGGGFDYFFSKHFSLGVDLTHNIINYDKIEIDLGDGATAGFEMDEAGAMTSLGLALAFYF